MPCSKCGFTLVFWDELICPKCEQYAMLDSITAVDVSKKKVEHVKKLWERYIVTLDKQSLLAHVTWQRESSCREFFEKYSLLKISKLLSDTLLIKRTMQVKGFQENSTKIDNENKAQKLTDMYEKTLRVEEDHILIASCLAIMLYLKKFDLNNLSGNELLSDFLILQNEKFLNLMKSYENYNILTEEEGERKIEQWKSEFEELMKKEIQPHEYTKEEFVSRFYDLITTLYVGLLRNRIFLEAFDLRPYSELLHDPAVLIKFVNTFATGKGGISGCNTAEFLIRAKKFFKRDIPFLRKILLFDDENSNIFPLFVRVKNKQFDYVLISHRFTALIYTFLHAVITKDLFDSETEKRSKKFEERIQIEFEKKGYDYQKNIKDRERKSSLEIDGVASKNGKCYVIESKARRLPTLVEEKQRRFQSIRDLKGIVDGIKYSTKNGKLEKKMIPSLLNKIEFVKTNPEQCKINKSTIQNYQGLIITIDYPWILEYKGVKIISINQIKEI